MASNLVESVDYLSKKIYLSAFTENKPLDTIFVYTEVQALRRSVESHQSFLPMIRAGGNVEIIPGVSATQPYVQLLRGCRIVPYDSNHFIRLVRETFTDDGLEGIDCFDRSTLSSRVDIDIDIDKIEIKELDVTEVGNLVWSSSKTPYDSVPGTMGNELVSLTTKINNIPSEVRTELGPELSHVLTLQNGQGLDSAQALMLLEIFKLYGLNPLEPLVVTTTTRSAGDIHQTIDTNETRTIITRQ